MKRNILPGLLFALAICLSSLVTSAHALESHDNIKGLFNTIRDVVVKCLECHKEKATEVLQSTHWTWKSSRMVNGQQVMHGKKDSLAGFAIDVMSNPARCLPCHISSIPEANVFEISAEAEVDCLVCHDTTGRYVLDFEHKKLEQADFELIARNVGKPSPKNCTTCHFADCGLTESLRPDAEAKGRKYFPPGDVHMSGAAESFACQTCHLKDSGHSISRTMIHGDTILQGEGCAACHSEAPHRLDRLNLHVAAVSCRTCHIPEYAVQQPAIISWNWFLIGKTSPIVQSLAGSESLLLDGNGFILSKMIRPVYLWDDGGDQVYSRGQRINPQELTYLQRPSERSGASKIAPFRIMYGTQLYDTKYRYLISPLLSTGDGQAFPNPDWDTAAREGMKAVVLPYSGEYGAAPTALFRRLYHGVAPARDALDCTDCHGSHGRLDWQNLGYARDPWSGEQAAPPETEPVQRDVAPQEIEKPAPLQDMQISPVPQL